MRSWVFATVTGLFVFVAGCGKEDATPANGGGAETASTKKSGDDHHTTITTMSMAKTITTRFPSARRR